MFSFKGVRYGPCFALLGASYHSLLQSSRCEEKKLLRESRKPVDSVSLYLKDDSKELLRKSLASFGFKNLHLDHVCIINEAEAGLIDVYAPLFGQRMAFRLKGIVKLDDGTAVGIGRVSSMVGELKETGYEVSLPLVSSEANSDTLQTLEDIPTRLAMLPHVCEKSFWKGRISSGAVHGRHYPAVHVQVTHLPITKQVVVDGYLCSGKHFNHELKKCEFDFDELVPLLDSASDEVEKEHQQEHDHVVVQEKQQEEAQNKQEDDADECPVCRYMKAGPCRDSFIFWDACIKGLGENDELNVCFPQTKEMMKCMQHNEYYDIMVAGTDYSKFEQAERLAAGEGENSDQQSAKDS